MSKNFMTILAIVIATSLLLALTTANVTLNNASGPIIPLSTQPIRMANILLDTKHVGASDLESTSLYSSIHTLSQNDISYFVKPSAEAITAQSSNGQKSFMTLDNEKEFYPFGKDMYFSFRTQTKESLESLNIDADDVDQGDFMKSTELHEFYLTIDESPIFASMDRTTTFAPSSGDESSTTSPQDVQLSTHTSFMGRRMNNRGEQEVLILTVKPNASQEVIDKDGKGSPNLETQSFDPLSGRMSDQYTIEGFLMSGTRTFQITTFTQLSFELNEDYKKVEDSLEQGQQQEQGQMSQQAIDMRVQSMNELSTLMGELSTQQLESSYDLVIVELNIDRLPGECGTHNHEHEEEEKDEVIDGAKVEEFLNTAGINDEAFKQALMNPLQANPQYFLKRWPASCNPYIGRIVVFSVQVFAAYSYRINASGSTTIDSSTDGRVDGRTKLLLQIINMVTQEQLGFVWKLAGTTYGTATGIENWNAKSASDTRCSLDNQTALTSVANLRGQHMDVSVLHALVTCANYGVVGIAYVDVLCALQNAGGVSSINGLYSWTTFGHELQHQVGALHPFSSSSDVGKYGGLMDYYNIRLPPSNANPGRYGFNQATDTSGTCKGLKSAFSSTRNGRLPIAQCFTMNDRNILTSSCGNGILDPWESCDGNNSCCNQCKLKTGATCSTGDGTCCKNCISQGPARCQLPGDSASKFTGMCGASGYCTPSVCNEIDGGWDGNSCPNSAFFPAAAGAKCGYACPLAGCGSAKISSRTNFDTGSSCLTSAGTAGVCVDTEPYNVSTSRTSTTATCVANTQLTYEWKYIVVAQCDCSNSLPLIDSYVCINTAGTPVADSYCAAATKPAQNTCCCNPPCAQDDFATGGDPNANSITSHTIIGSLFIVIIAIFF